MQEGGGGGGGEGGGEEGLKFEFQLGHITILEIDHEIFSRSANSRRAAISYSVAKVCAQVLFNGSEGLVHAGKKCK